MPKAEGSRAPSYFSQFFEKQLQNFEEGQQIRTLYIDRDPDTFKDIARHLQGMAWTAMWGLPAWWTDGIQDTTSHRVMASTLSDCSRMRSSIAVGQSKPALWVPSNVRSTQADIATV